MRTNLVPGLTAAALLLAALPARAQDLPPATPAETAPPPVAEPLDDHPDSPARTPSRPAADQSIERAPSSQAPEIGRLLLGARIGGLFPEPFNKLDANFLAEIEVAYQLPVPRIDRRLGIFLDVGYMQPERSGTRSDPRVPAGTEDWKMTVRDLGLTLGLQYLHPLPKRFLVYGGLGARMHLTRTLTSASAGSTPLGENTEDSTRLGVAARLGAGYRVGPGAVVLEAQFEWSSIDHLITGGERPGESANTSSLVLQAGYHFFLL